MVSVRVALDRDGVVSRVEARGHADGARRGENVACAAVTTLVRSAFEALASEPGVDAAATAPTEGELRFAVRRCADGAREAARGITSFLTIGLSGVEREYPGSVELTIEAVPKN